MDIVKVAGMELGQILVDYPQEVEQQLKQNLSTWEKDAKDAKRRYIIISSLSLILLMGFPFIMLIGIMNYPDNPLTVAMVIIGAPLVFIGFILMFVSKKYSAKKEKAYLRTEKKNALSLTLLLMRRDAMLKVCSTHWMCHKCGLWLPQGVQSCTCGTCFDRNLSKYRFQKMLNEVNQFL